MGLLLFAVLVTSSAKSWKQHLCNVLDFGAVGDNKTEDTAAVKAAISACPGSTVLIPEGHVFLLRPIELPSNLELRVEGTIVAWPNHTTWPNSTTKRCPTTPYQTPLENVTTAPQLESLIYSANASNVSITGTGLIDGQGWRWWPLRKLPGNYWHSCR
jgi:polygalacturonase